MKSAISTELTILALVVACSVAASGALGAARYTLTDLGPGQAHAINDSGQVVGSSQPLADPATLHAFLYSDSRMIDLGYLGYGNESGAYAINSPGQVAGYSYVVPGVSCVAFLYSGGSMLNLGGANSYGFGINDLGQEVGYSGFWGPQRATLWNGGSAVNLGTLGGGSMALGINNSGQIVGWSCLADNSTYHAFLYSGGAMTDLQTSFGPGTSGANGINDHGQIVGSASVNGNPEHAFLLSDGTVTDLGSLGGNNSYAYAINNSGQIVGLANASNGAKHAFLYEGGAMQDLNDLVSNGSGLTLCEAQAINNRGQIVGMGTRLSGQNEAFLLTPITNSPPVLDCPPPLSVAYGFPPIVYAAVSDPDGDLVTLVWTLNGVAVQTNTALATAPPIRVLVSFSPVLSLGTNLIELVATDPAGATASCATTVTVVDTTPPIITQLKAEPSILWPPDHKMVTVQVDAEAVDACSTATWKIISVSSNELLNERGQGNTAPDWQIVGDHAVELRAERSGTSHDRIYTLTVQATDAAGNLSWPRTVTVTVPKSQGKAP
jgi:probable HAF family extracellular repeat protein